MLFSFATGVSFATVPDKKPKSVLPVQEKVYLHFDNNCYFLGDTIWYKAYVVLADDNSPEPLSRILYVELLNEQGYLMERQQLEINKLGQANGCFAISDTTFAGFYEIRAYTKWMLNFGYDYVKPWYDFESGVDYGWGRKTINGSQNSGEHADAMYSWLMNYTEDVKYANIVKSSGYHVPTRSEQALKDRLAEINRTQQIEDDEYRLNKSLDPHGMQKMYRDYHYLFSRVLPVYSRPDTAEHYMRKVMPTKITAGDYRVDWKTPEFDVRFYPEGGYLLEGQQCRVAWEAMNQQLERLNVSGVLLEDGEPIDSVRPIHAGRGLITLDVKKGKKYKVRFEFEKEKFTFDLPDAEEEGVRLWLEQDEEGVYIDLAQTFRQPRPLYLNIYYRGKRTVSNYSLKDEDPVAIPLEDLEEGVNQAVVTDQLGNVYADRLFFVNKCYESQAKVMVAGIANRPYQPLEKIRLNLIATDPKGYPLKNQTFSVSVRDEAQLDPSFATGNIMTNLLLESDLKGFVENPDYYFEADDEKHRQALDLLMLVQGWRRYDWRYIDYPEYFQVDYLPEQKMVIYGDAIPLRSSLTDLIKKQKRPIRIACSMLNMNDDLKEGDTYLFNGVVEADTSGHFQIAYDPFYGNVKLALRAQYATSKKVEKEKIQNHDPKIFVRKQAFYPQSLKAYSWYETYQPDITKDKKLTWEDYQEDIYASEWIPQVNIRSKRRPHSKLQKDKPVAQIDFLEFLNELWDRGRYPQIQPLDGKKIFFLLSTDPEDAPFNGDTYIYPISNYIKGRYENTYNKQEVQQFGINWNVSGFNGRLATIEHLPILDRIYVVSDAPRRPVPFEHYHQDRTNGGEGVFDRTNPDSPPGENFIGSKGIDAYINLITFPDDKTRITVGREYNFQGFTRPVEYYNPDYSKAKLSEIKDYRRTLYWNPNVTTDNFGQASIEFYNNSVCNIIDVSAEGITKFGQFLLNE
ncbi:MAG: hypothetical protein J5720_07175 [Bacteroidaceae bacterium]|nr:hypothetical protein [Bacteroidaceae bacterium]